MRRAGVRARWERRGAVAGGFINSGAARELRAETPAARRQAACYGLGVAATALQTHFAPYAATAVQALVQQMAARPDASTTAACLPVEGFGDDDSDYEDVSDDEDGNAVQEALVADNAASALARVLVVSCPDAGAWALWVQYMPLLADCTEADAALTCLCEGIRTSSLPAPLNLVVSCLGRCAVALKAGAHGTTARGTSPTEFLRTALSSGSAERSRRLVGSPRASSSRRCPTTRGRRFRECAL